MKQLLLIISLFALLAGRIPAVADEAKKDGVFIHITHGEDNPRRVLMALKLAGKMADKHDVMVYFDLDAVNVVMADAKDLSSPNFETSKAYLDGLRKKKVKLVACDGCIIVAGKTEKDLAPDVKLANHDEFFTFTKGRILTLDY